MKKILFMMLHISFVFGMNEKNEKIYLIKSNNNIINGSNLKQIKILLDCNEFKKNEGEGIFLNLNGGKNKFENIKNIDQYFNLNKICKINDNLEKYNDLQEYDLQEYDLQEYDLQEIDLQEIDLQEIDRLFESLLAMKMIKDNTEERHAEPGFIKKYLCCCLPNNQ